MAIEIAPATVKHVLELKDTLRPEDQAEILSFGLTLRKAVYRSWRESIWSRCALVNGHVAAIWGVHGQLLGSIGVPWLLTSKSCEDVSPISFAKIYTNEVQEMHELFPVLRNIVDSKHKKAIRMLRLAGFSIQDAKPFGLNGNLFCVFERKEDGSRSDRGRGNGGNFGSGGRVLSKRPIVGGIAEREDRPEER